MGRKAVWVWCLYFSHSIFIIIMTKRLLHSHKFHLVECENYSLCFCLLCCDQGGCRECGCVCVYMCVCQVWSLQNWSDSLLFAGRSPTSVGTVCEAELDMKPPTLGHMWTPSSSTSYPQGHLGGAPFFRLEFDIPLMMLEAQYSISFFFFLMKPDITQTTVCLFYVSQGTQKYLFKCPFFFLLI